jgi:hypothetical protein
MRSLRALLVRQIAGGAPAVSGTSPKFFRLNRVRRRARTDGTVEQITGTPPRTFRDLARKNAAGRSEDSK